MLLLSSSFDITVILPRPHCHCYQVEELGDSQLVAATMQLIEEARLMARFIMIEMMMMLRIILVMMMNRMLMVLSRRPGSRDCRSRLKEGRRRWEHRLRLFSTLM